MLVTQFFPGCNRIAFVSDLTGVPQVWTVPTDGGWPTLVTALDDQVRVVNWSPYGQWLAFGLTPGGGMNEQIYLVRPDGTGLIASQPSAKITTGWDPGSTTAEA